jgi:hypothetical protein
MQTISLLAQLVILGILGFLVLVAGYAVGFNEGEKEGFRKGRSMARHASSWELNK